MKWVALLLQIFSFRSSLLESRAMIENAKAVAEKGRRAAIFSGVVLVAAVYFIVGSVLTVVELGLQVDRGEPWHFSGLLASSLLLVVFALLAVGAAALLMQGPKAPPPPPPEPRSELKAAWENVLLAFLTQLGKKLGEEKEPGRSQGERGA